MPYIDSAIGEQSSPDTEIFALYPAPLILHVWTSRWPPVTDPMKLVVKYCAPPKMYNRLLHWLIIDHDLHSLIT